MENFDFTWRIGGEAGFGIMVTGTSLAKTCTRSGLNIISNTEYPSLIRGGHNNFTVRASSQKIYALTKPVNFLVALNKDTVVLEKNDLAKNATLIFDPKDYEPQKNDLPPEIKLISIPLYQLAKDNNGDVVMRNTVALGATIAIMGLNFKILEKVLTDQFIKKGQEVVDQNIKTAKAGFDFISQNLKPALPSNTNAEQNPNKIVLTGSEAIALAAISSGMKFFTAYPMTPINGLITFMAEHDKKLSVVYKQPEDEISGINMAIGASFTGVRSMTATSGGGFALMNEAFSMAGITETPLVVVYGQRPGPASGLPTWTSQGDLSYALNAGHGEFLRIVLAPGDTEEAYWLTKLAFNLADKYQTPVIVLTDKYLSESCFSLDKDRLETTEMLPQTVVNYAKTIDRGKIEQKPDNTYQRYKITDDGISPRLYPGRGMWLTINSYEHNESGLSTEIAGEIKAMVDKRNKKADLAQNEAFGPIVYGKETADLTIVGWGTTKMAVLECLNMLAKEKVKWTFNYVHFNCLSPFPIDSSLAVLKKAKRIIDVELNSTFPFAKLLREKIGIEIKDKILKYDGRQFYPEEIISALKILHNQ